jgi:hypothetical protein
MSLVFGRRHDKICAPPVAAIFTTQRAYNRDLGSIYVINRQSWKQHMQEFARTSLNMHVSNFFIRFESFFIRVSELN